MFSFPKPPRSSLLLMGAGPGNGDATPGGPEDALLLEDDASGFLMEDGTSDLLMESAP